MHHSKPTICTKFHCCTHYEFHRVLNLANFQVAGIQSSLQKYITFTGGEGIEFSAIPESKICYICLILFRLNVLHGEFFLLRITSALAIVVVAAAAAAAKIWLERVRSHVVWG